MSSSSVASARSAQFCASLEACGGSVTLTTPESLADSLATLVGGDGLVLVSDRAPGPRGEPAAPGVASSRLTLGLLEALRGRGVDARLGTVAALGGPEGGPDAALGRRPDGDADGAAQAFRTAGAAITGTLLGIASLGTIAIAPRGGNEGLLACLPPHHVAILREADIVADLSAAFVRLGEVFARDQGEFVFVTGPSRTADIEMMTVLGVHGPLRLDVVVVCGDVERSADVPGVDA